MTDKQIIIDGVDVSGCKHYKNRTCIIYYYLTDMPFDEAKCELNPNCYYKRWQRKEQECEAYKMEAEEGKEINAELKAMQKDLYLENQKFCYQIEELTKQHNQLKTELKDMTIRKINYLNESLGYKQKLEKIKDYCVEQNLKAYWTACEILKIIEE